MENTISVKEFKAWLEGFEESFSSYQPYPNKEQWEKIVNKIHQLQEDGSNWQYYNPWKNFDNAKPLPLPFNAVKGDLYCDNNVKTSVKEAPSAPGYI